MLYNQLYVQGKLIALLSSTSLMVDVINQSSIISDCAQTKPEIVYQNKILQLAIINQAVGIWMEKLLPSQCLTHLLEAYAVLSTQSQISQAACGQHIYPFPKVSRFWAWSLFSALDFLKVGLPNKTTKILQQVEMSTLNIGINVPALRGHLETKITEILICHLWPEADTCVCSSMSILNFSICTLEKRKHFALNSRQRILSQLETSIQCLGGFSFFKKSCPKILVMFEVIPCLFIRYPFIWKIYV